MTSSKIKKTKEKTTSNTKKSSKNENLTKGLIAQLISLIILMILVIWGLFNRSLLPYADFMAALTFFIMAFNKRKQNKITSITCIIFGIIFILIAIWSLING